MLDALLSLSAQIKAQKLPTYRRFLYKQIDFSQRLIGVMGARGAGKTTLLLQYLQSLPTAQKSLYVIADHPLVEQHGLFEIANVFQQHGGEVLLIDEIHKHRGFERDLKLIYDSFFQLKVIFTGSLATAIDHAKADLSRRAMVYNLPNFEQDNNATDIPALDFSSTDELKNVLDTRRPAIAETLHHLQYQ